ncbi:MAG: thrombospondin type 3 repeat-containing protein [Myxococcales bacterium]
MRIQSLFVLAASFMLITAATKSGLASPPFPEALKGAVPSLPCVPQCILCHQTNLGGVPASKPFAMILKAAAPVAPENTDSLRAAIAALQAKGATSDADGDGQGDYDELSTGSDPNSADAAATLCTSVPLYGCGATIARRTPRDLGAPLWAFGVLLVGAVLRRRRRLPVR